jgi:hypothetical protein
MAKFRCHGCGREFNYKPSYSAHLGHCKVNINAAARKLLGKRKAQIEKEAEAKRQRLEMEPEAPDNDTFNEQEPVRPIS